MQLCALISAKRFSGKTPEPAILKYTDESGKVHGPLWTGKQIFSLLLPETLNYTKKTNIYKEPPSTLTGVHKKLFSWFNDSVITIERGQILSGILDKKSLGVSGGSLIHCIFNDYGQERVRHFTDQIQWIANHWLLHNGFSIGISDCMLHTESSKSVIANFIAESVDKAESIAAHSLKTDARKAEEKINTSLNNATTNVGKYVQTTVSNRNSLIAMVNAGSKGNHLNVSQIMAIVGQQNLAGKRIPMNNMGRALPHFKHGDQGPAARGFVRSSYYNGLSPTELFFHTVGGREGLVDTAIKSVTGDTPLIIYENGTAKRVNIGDWIDGHLDCIDNKDIVEHHKELEMELLHIDNIDVRIPTTDMKGNVSWAKVTALTRHNPTEKLYKIKTLSGRHVTVAESKSLIVWNMEKKEFEQVNTANVKIGDFVPVTSHLKTSNDMILSHIDMDKYLPRTEYLYGSDFHRAKDLFEENLQVSEKLWNTKNGHSFVVPHKNGRLFKKCIKTTTISNIFENYIYPFYGKRINTNIPERLELNRENGFFIGLYIAEGDSDSKAGSVRISNNDPELIDICKKWYNKFNMQWDVSKKTNHTGGTSISIRGFSTVMAEFMNRFVGQGAENKRIPNEAYTAPIEFVKGLIDGYFSGDGCVAKNSFNSSSCSEQLTEGVSFLLARLGIFSKLWKTQIKSNNFGTENIKPTFNLSVRSQWGTKFQNEILLSHPEKQQKSDNLSFREIHQNYPQINDVVLDGITSIDVVDASLYPKVYDMTVPGTFTFSTATGLMCYDTAETG